ncbi:MAG: DNA polymerase III subunit epsilon [Rhodospirillaceae bacterium]
MREIVFDTETTGFKPDEGHRLIEIGCVELFNTLPTGQTRQWYVNPERDVPDDAVRVHGLTADFLEKYPVFGNVVGEILEFLGDAPLVAHNAPFDMSFLNAELKRCGHRPLKNKVTDTVQLARKKFPGAPASLDALCKRFGIDNSSRSYHGALLDASLLAEVYLELSGGRQTALVLDSAGEATAVRLSGTRKPRPARPHTPSPEERAAHTELLKKLKNPVWLN